MANTVGTGALGRLRNVFSSQDMTQGSPAKGLLIFSIPLLVGNIAQQIYATVDTMIVGNYMENGVDAIAAIGATGPIINLLLVFMMAIATGAGIMVSQYFGARERDMLGRTIGMSIVWIALASFMIMAVGATLSRPILELLNTPENVIGMATDYLMIVTVGILGNAFYNILSGILRGLGDSFMPLIFLLFACVLNIFLDIYFVANLGMGVAGVAYATIISQSISAVFCFIRLFRMQHIVGPLHNKLRIDKGLSKTLFSLGLPAGITQMIFSMSMIMVQSLTNSMGEVVMATSTMVMRVDGFAMMPNFTFGMAIATFVGQNVGANRLDRVTEGTKAMLKIAVTTSVTMIVLLLFFSGPLLRTFVQDELVISLGIRQIRILAVGYLFMTFTQIFGGIMRGAGDTMPSMIISIINTVVVRVPLAYLLAHLTASEAWPNGSPDALYISLLVTWAVGAAATYLWYRRGAWRNMALTRAGREGQPAAETAETICAD